MKSPSSPDRLLGIIEPLEARIAPAQVFIGHPDLQVGKDIEYREGNPLGQTLLFTNTSAGGSFETQEEGNPDVSNDDLISQAVDGVRTDPMDDPSKYLGTYYMQLKAGDVVFRFTEGNNYQRLIEVQAGFVVAFFVDYNHNNEYEDGEFTGLALSRDASVLVADKVYGDIVTNLDTHGTNSNGDDTLDMTGLVSAKQGIKSLQVTGGSVFGSVFSGGNIQKLLIGGNVGRDRPEFAAGFNADTAAGGVYAGTATNGRSFDFFPDPLNDVNPATQIAGGQGTITFEQPAGKAGATIKNANIVSVGSTIKLYDNALQVVDSVVVNDIQAGNGGFGAAGGNLQMIQVTNDSDGVRLRAGNGGAAVAAANQMKGGAGGAVSQIYVSGAFDSTPNGPLLSQRIEITAGFGGDGLVTTKGGAGGLAKNVFVGYDFDGTGAIPSENLTGDNVLIQAGSGGSGSTGGAGGAIKASKVRVQTPDAPDVPTEPPKVEITLKAGLGGGDILSPAAVKAGPGGMVKNVEVRNQILTFDSDILVAAGSAGITVGDGKGAAGGAIVNATLLGFDLQVLAGDGSGGKKGGLGGSIDTLHILEDDDIFTHNALLNAGKGGNGNGGPGGAGGNVETLLVDNSDIQNFTINSGSQGNGGDSIGSKGGKGGRVVGLSLIDTDTGFLIEGPISIRAGTGGSGDKGGAAGGALKQVQVAAVNAHVDATAGHGGSAMVKGLGGAGGKVKSVQLTAEGKLVSDESPLGMPAHANVTAGSGGDGKGKKGAGGKGGDASFVNINATGDVALVAGDGGNGAFNSVSGTTVVPGGAPGRGGNIQISGVFAPGIPDDPTTATDESLPASGELRAGDAGADGNAPAAGGSIFGGSQGELVGLRAVTSITAIGGDGSHGGAGGSISNLSYGGVVFTPGVGLTPTPAGNILIQAGHGSSEGAVAGAGGSLKLIDGSISSGLNTTTMLLGGDGGSILSKNLPVTEETPGGPGTSEVQRLNISALAGIAKARFTLTLGSVTSERISATTNLSDFRAKLDAAFGPGTLTVARVPNSKTQFTLTFSANGDQPLIVATGYTGSVAAKGGNISEVAISLGGGNGVEFMAEAGDGGDALGNGKVGGKGGKVTAMGLALLDDQTIVRSIAAGDGGDARKIGGAGGGVTFVAVQDHDIGVRSGLKFGYDAMGGLFVGAGGKATLSPSSGGKAGLAGSASDITANAIASIVAGRTLVPELAEKVSRIILNEVNQLKVSAGALVENSPFTLTFMGDTTDSDPLLPGNQPLPGDADEPLVEAALNALPSIQNTAPGGLGTVTVAPGTNLNVSVYSTYIVTFTATGDQVLLTGEEQVPAEVTTTVAGQIITFPTTERLVGDSVLPVLETTPGQRDLTFVETTSGDSLFSSTEQQRGDILTFPPISEVQRISLLPLTLFPTGMFNLTFGANTTMNLPANATAPQIQTALNSLASIRNLTTPPANNVIVTSAGNSSFDIFFTPPGDVQPITGHLLVPETQRLLLGDLPTFTTGQMTLTFGGSTTAPIASTSTAAQIDAALEGLASIIALPGTAGNKVAVALVQPGVFNITFGSIGEKAPLTGTGFLPETQQVDLGMLPTVPTATFKLSYNSVETGPIAVAADGSGPAAADIDAALEAVTSIQALAGPAGNKVSVVKTSSNLFNVTFNSNGDKLAFVAEGFTREIQTLDLGTIATTFGAEFTLDVSHFVTTREKVNGVTRPVFTRTIQEGQVDLFVAETTQGSANVQEVQLLNLGPVAGSTSGRFILDFLGEQTGPLMEVGNPVDPIATAMAIESALAVLQTVIDAGGVLVMPGATAGTYNLTFASQGDQARFVATGLVQERQGVDLATVRGLAGGEFTLSIADPVNPAIIYTTSPIPENATPAMVTTALTALGMNAIGLGVAVAPGTAPDEYLIQFQDIGDRNLFMGAGGGTVDHETQTIDLSSLIPFGANQSFNLSFGGASTASLMLTGVDATDAAAIQNALNALNTIQNVRPDPSPAPPNSPGMVAVVSTAPGVFDATFNFFGDQPLIGGVSRVGPDAQHIGLTTRLPYNATAAQIQAAIQPVSLANVSVTPGTVTNTFDITFLENGDQPAINVTGYLHETQNVDVYAVGDFNLTFNGTPVTVNGLVFDRVADANDTLTRNDPGGSWIAEGFVPGQKIVISGTGSNNGTQTILGVTATVLTFAGDVLTDETSNATLRGADTTNRFAPPPDPAIDPVGAAASEAALDAALEALPSIQALPGPMGNQVEVHVGPNSSFIILFHSDGDVAPLDGTQFEAMYVSASTFSDPDTNGTPPTPGPPATPGTRESQEIAYARKGEFEPVYFSQVANLVGGIWDINEIDANVFHYLHDGMLMSGSGFQLGDTPIDGLIMAKNLNQNSLNFTPEAKLTLSGFFDHDNAI